MRITCIIHSLAGGGAERVMAALASALTERHHHATLITLDDGRQDRHDVAEGVERIALDLMHPRRSAISALAANARRIAQLRSAIRRSRPGVVLSFCDRTNVLTLLATRGLTIPVVVSERSNPEKQQLPWPWSSLRPRLYRHAAAVIVLTPAAAEMVSRWSAQSPIVIPSAIQLPPDFKGSAPLERPDSESRTIIGIGRLEIEKGFDLLIEAFANVVDPHRNWKLVIYGEGSLRSQLEQQREQLGLTKLIELPGWKRPIWPVLQASDLFVLPSRYEGFPSALLEAMAAGLPCIAFDCPSGPGVIIRDHHDGLLVPNGDLTAMSTAMHHCMGDPVLRTTLGQRAAKSIQRFDWQAMVDAYECVLLSHCKETVLK